MAPFKTTKTIETPTLGRAIRNARTDRGVSIEELAEATKIQPNYLRNLEQEKFSALPAPVYVRGLLRRIARVLQCDAAALLSLYERERQVSEHVGEADYQDRPLGLRRGRTLSVTPRTVTIAIVVLLVLGVVVYLGVQVGDVFSAPTLAVHQPSGNIVAESQTVRVVGQTESGISLTINGEDVHVDEQGAFEIELPLQEGVNQIHVRAENRFGQTAEVVREVVVPISSERTGG